MREWERYFFIDAGRFCDVHKILYISILYCLYLFTVSLPGVAQYPDQRREFFVLRQDADTRHSLGIGGGIGRSVWHLAPRIENAGQLTLTYAGKPTPGFNQSISVIDEQRQNRDVKMGEFNADFFARLTRYPSQRRLV